MEPPDGEVFPLPYDNKIFLRGILFLRYWVLTTPSYGSFLFHPLCGQRKGKKMYFNAVEFGKRLQEVRRNRGFTQAELADCLGLTSSQHISKIERGEKSCSLDLLVELSCVLQVSTDYLLKGENADREQMKKDLKSAAAKLERIANEI